MKRDRLNTELQGLERKIRLLLSEYNSLKQEHENMKTENTELKDLLSNKDNQLDNFQNKNNIATIVNNIVTGESEAPAVKERLNDYIKEIDKCIQHLGE